MFEDIPNHFLEICKTNSKNFKNFFYDEKRGICDVVEHEINLIDSRQIKQSIRRIPFHQKAEVRKAIEEMKS